MIVSTAVEGRSYAEVRTNEQARSDASDATPLRVPARGGVWWIWFTFGVAPVNRPVARHRISLSSGIRMFARESLTRGDLLNSVVLCRAGLRIPNYN